MRPLLLRLPLAAASSLPPPNFSLLNSYTSVPANEESGRKGRKKARERTRSCEERGEHEQNNCWEGTAGLQHSNVTQVIFCCLSIHLPVCPMPELSLLASVRAETSSCVPRCALLSPVPSRRPVPRPVPRPRHSRARSSLPFAVPSAAPAAPRHRLSRRPSTALLCHAQDQRPARPVISSLVSSGVAVPPDLACSLCLVAAGVALRDLLAKPRNRGEAGRHAGRLSRCRRFGRESPHNHSSICLLLAAPFLLSPSACVNVGDWNPCPAFPQPHSFNCSCIYIFH